MMAFFWRYESSDGTDLGKSHSFDNQSDAETWLGLEFEAIAELGASQVTLFEGGNKIYGPMSLEA